VSGVIGVFEALVVAYFLVLNLSYMVLLVLGWLGVSRYVRHRPFEAFDEAVASELTQPLTIIVPAYNEEPVIVESLTAMLATRYPRFEVVLANDGSKDGTLERLREAFELEPSGRVPRARLESQPVRGVYASRREPRLLVVDKENGGRSDALNAALSYARYPLICATDADTLLDDDALLRLTEPFMLDPDRVVGCGGVVRIANGCRVEGGRVTEVRTPRNHVPLFQIIEYLRAFLVGRTGWARIGALVIISGALGVFRRDAMLEVGGYDPSTIGEDAELVVRLHRHMRDRGAPYRMVFLPDPVCWTQAPGDLRQLSRQRDRWHRGLLEVLVKHRSMILNPRYGVVGMLALPYFLVFEALGPAVETLGMALTAYLLATGQLGSQYVFWFMLLSVVWGLIFSFGSLVLEEHAFRRYRSFGCLLRLSYAALMENLGYRQLLTLVRTRAYWSFLKGDRGWGELRRERFDSAPPAEPAEPERRAA
jgi:cellulose synthase/poly-beta-1,6-N-acetylglucosamine synthase-like glycosyltransferase